MVRLLLAVFENTAREQVGRRTEARMAEAAKEDMARIRRGGREGEGRGSRPKRGVYERGRLVSQGVGLLRAQSPERPAVAAVGSAGAAVGKQDRRRNAEDEGAALDEWLPLDWMRRTICRVGHGNVPGTEEQWRDTRLGEPWQSGIDGGGDGWTT